MDYELAKKLKEAGFPQEGEFVWIDRNLKKIETNEQRTIVLWKDVVSEWEPNCEILCYNPTLSELIDACGDGFRFLIHEKDPRSLKEWRCNNDKSEWKEDGFWGKTPEEAIANLWLSLNK